MQPGALVLAVGLTAVAGSSVPPEVRVHLVQDVPVPAPADPKGEGEKAEPRTIWPASLERISGRYVFAQIASPGGLWLGRPSERRQVSLNELPPAMRARLSSAEIIISDLKLPGTVEASQRLSPSKRGMLRYYEEEAQGTLKMKNLPGVEGDDVDKGAYTGPVVFSISHTSHSNPSVSGVLNQRRQSESTWGAATLDYADLNAVLVPAADAKPDDELPMVLANARILRSGVEIFAFVGWSDKDAAGETRTYTGAVRLERRDPGAPAVPPAVPAVPRAAPAKPRVI